MIALSPNDHARLLSLVTARLAWPSIRDDFYETMESEQGATIARFLVLGQEPTDETTLKLAQSFKKLVR